ncbi:MAG: hypothetical protein KDJ77_04465 [Rhodobiaceae bacterium]|nr:hypothetical protein [Rhodobiaceae bacterium]
MALWAILLLVTVLVIGAIMDFRVLRALQRLASTFYRRTLNPAHGKDRK